MAEINFVEIASTVVAACAVAATIWPEPKNSTLRKFWKLVNYIGANFGMAKNKEGK